MILVDANVLMYAAGSPHPNKTLSLAFLKRVSDGEVEASIDAEVLQEVLHRYRVLNRWSEGREVYATARELFPHVLAVTAGVMDRARNLLDDHIRITARDAIHAAVVLEYQLEGICTFDRDFDRIRGCRRLGLR